MTPQRISYSLCASSRLIWPCRKHSFSRWLSSDSLRMSCRLDSCCFLRTSERQITRATWRGIGDEKGLEMLPQNSQLKLNCCQLAVQSARSIDRARTTSHLDGSAVPALPRSEEKAKERIERFLRE